MARRVMTSERSIGVATGEVGAGGRSGQRSAAEMSSASSGEMRASTAEMCVTTAEMTATEMAAAVAATEMTATAVATATMSTASASAGVSRTRKRDGEYDHRQEIEL
jgi:hypothetical protein